jgi:hypothetical protein
VTATLDDELDAMAASPGEGGLDVGLVGGEGDGAGRPDRRLEEAIDGRGVFGLAREGEASRRPGQLQSTMAKRGMID